jgi:hypothetical protein
MNRNAVNYCIDALAGLCMVVMVLTGYILRFVLPSGSNRTHVLWSLGRHEWGTIHFWSSLVLLAVLVLHYLMHADWIMVMTGRGMKRQIGDRHTRIRMAVWLGLGVILVGVLMGQLAHRQVRERTKPLHPLASSLERQVTGVRVVGTVDYMRDIRPIMDRSCLECHGPVKQKAGLRVDRKSDLMNPGPEQPWIVPGVASNSRLIEIVSGRVKDIRAYEAHQLPPVDIALLERWINEGAIWPDSPVR